MISPKILIQGKFVPSDIIILVSPSNRKIDPEKESQIEALWLEKEKRAKENGQRIYNGLSYRLNSFKTEANSLYLDFGIFDFKTRECLVEVPGYYDLSEEYFRKGCHTLATVKTSDDKYLMVELTGKSMNTNKTDFLGGIMETEPPIKTGDDLFDSLYRELEEEAFIAKDEIKECFLKLIYLNDKTNVGFYFEIQLSMLSDHAQKRFDENQKEIDIRSLKILSRIDYLTELKNHNKNKQFVSNFIEI